MDSYRESLSKSASSLFSPISVVDHEDSSSTGLLLLCRRFIISSHADSPMRKVYRYRLVIICAHVGNYAGMCIRVDERVSLSASRQAYEILFA
jgi:hypothetical protein